MPEHWRNAEIQMFKARVKIRNYRFWCLSGNGRLKGVVSEWVFTVVFSVRSDS